MLKYLQSALGRAKAALFIAGFLIWMMLVGARVLFAAARVQRLERTGRPVPQDLRELAESDIS